MVKTHKGMRALLALVVVAAAGVTAITASARSSGATRTLRVVERARTDTTVDVGARGDSTGDLLTFHNQVFDRSNRRRIGSDVGHCVRIVPGESYDCAWTLLLPRGHLAVYGPFYDKRDSVLVITGGTGVFRRAHGQMRLHARAGGTSFDFVYQINR